MRPNVMENMRATTDFGTLSPYLFDKNWKNLLQVHLTESLNCENNSFSHVSSVNGLHHHYVV